MIIPVNLDKENYNVIIEKASLLKIDNYINYSNKNLVIYDKNIDEKYLKVFNTTNEVFFYKIDVSEAKKSISEYQKIVSFLLDNNFTKSDLIIAFGGGVIGDLAGFVASTYKRGCLFINIPTSTLSMVDSCVGGKVALNFSNTKNAIGAFYQPKTVIIDIDVLKTLNKRHFNNGLVEALKAGLIGDIELFRIFQNNMQNEKLEEVIERSILVKKKIVEEDLYDLGVRKYLNFGHTIGHAIESTYLDKVYHGEAVAFGMLFMLESPLKEEVKRILDNLSINKFLKIDKTKVFEFLKNDKKREKDTISVIKMKEINQPFIVNLSIEEIYKILQGE